VIGVLELLHTTTTAAAVLATAVCCVAHFYDNDYYKLCCARCAVIDNQLRCGINTLLPYTLYLLLVYTYFVAPLPSQTHSLSNRFKASSLPPGIPIHTVLTGSHSVSKNARTLLPLLLLLLCVDRENHY
jgi:hypothetical protein